MLLDSLMSSPGTELVVIGGWSSSILASSRDTKVRQCEIKISRYYKGS